MHEDDLINHRVGWFIQLHSFLIASYTILFGALIGTFTAAGTSGAFGVLLARSLACLLLVGITLVGRTSARAARTSIMAAGRTIDRLQADWTALRDRHGWTGLPDVTAAGDAEATGGNLLHDHLPRTVGSLWVASWAIPAATMLVALWQFLPPGIWSRPG